MIALRLMQPQRKRERQFHVGHDAFCRTLAHFAQRNNRPSVVALGFRPGKQFPRLTLHPPHFVKQGFTEALFVLGLGLGKCIGDVAFVLEPLDNPFGPRLLLM